MANDCIAFFASFASIGLLISVSTVLNPACSSASIILSSAAGLMT
ncbi:hypothetical protein [uncultured Bifidobacterium sp.]|nr:hypothetical protein [uncultured Bifidobacterium sp.]